MEIKAVVTALQKNLAKALKVLDHQINSLHKILDQCLSKGVEKSVELCVGTKNTMMASVSIILLNVKEKPFSGLSNRSDILAF